MIQGLSHTLSHRKNSMHGCPYLQPCSAESMSFIQHLFPCADGVQVLRTLDNIANSCAFMGRVFTELSEATRHKSPNT